MADLGFSRGGRIPPRGVRQPIILQNFCRKLHENQRNLFRAPLDPPLLLIDEPRRATSTPQKEGPTFSRFLTVVRKF